MSRFIMEAILSSDDYTDRMETSLSLLRECDKRTAALGSVPIQVSTEFITQFRDENNVWIDSPDTIPEQLEATQRNIVRTIVTYSKSPVVIVVCRPYDVEDAISYARGVWPNHKGEIFTITSKTALSIVHGWKQVPYTIYNYPITLLHWYRDLEYHERSGRIVRVMKAAPGEAPAEAPKTRPVDPATIPGRAKPEIGTSSA